MKIGESEPKVNILMYNMSISMGREDIMAYTQHRQQDTVDAILQREKVRGDHIRVQTDRQLALEAQNNPEDGNETLSQKPLFARLGLWLRRVFKGY